MMRLMLGVAASLLVATAAAALQAPASYGPAISLDRAKRIVSAAETAARARNFTMAFAVVDPTGELLLFHRMDGTQYGSTVVAQEKARTAARFKRPTKAFSDSVAGGRTVVLSVPGVIAIEGGLPIIVDGRIVGALGISGASSEQDGEIAAAALASAN